MFIPDQFQKPGYHKNQTEKKVVKGFYPKIFILSAIAFPRHFIDEFFQKVFRIKLIKSFMLKDSFATN